MKIRFHKESLVDLNRPRSSAVLHHSSSRSGIALVITLIMLSVTLIMAVSFLAVSNRERGSVTTGTDSNHARLAAESALANAEAQIMVNILSTTNPYNFGLLVSTNYINRYGFHETIASPTNVNYDYISGTEGPGPNGALSANDLVQNIANLEYLPRAPVFVPNSSASGYDFRYYLDLNRNGMFDDTYGSLTNWQMVNGSLVQNGTVSEIGDPQWIGVLEHPDQPHGPLNRFIGRYCFVAVPVGNTLDANAMYNDVMGAGGNPAMKSGLGDGFFRNEGVGTWELNLAAFLADLNTNEWDTTANPYKYLETTVGNPSGPLPNEGAAFEDAFALLGYRYNYNVHTETNILYLNYKPLSTNYIDVYSGGPLMTNSALLAPFTASYSATEIAQTPWDGWPSTNFLFSLADFFNPAETEFNVPGGTPGFTDRLLFAGTNTYPTTTSGRQVPTYDRYTFYRMLSELGSDSEPEHGKINVNYNNVDVNGNVVPGAETNFVKWTSLPFFTAAADHLLKLYTTNWYNNSAATVYVNGIGGATEPSAHYYFTNTFGGTNVFNSPNFLTGQPFGITNIPVWVNGRFVYSSAVNRLLQLAANIYDASNPSNLPSVFRPLFARDTLTGNIFIRGYTNIAFVNPITATTDPANPLYTPVDISALVAGNIPVGGGAGVRGLNNVNVYGVPWIIGAKKNLPSFNELYMQNNATVIRKLQVNKPGVSTASTGWTTNQMYIMSITNLVGMSFWNSYYSNYTSLATPPGNLMVYMQDTMRMTNLLGNASVNPLQTPLTYSYFTNISAFSAWSGSYWNPNVQPPSAAQAYPGSFIPVVFTNVALPPSEYWSQTGQFFPISNNPVWETNVVNNYVFPQTTLVTTNWVQAYILDGNNVVDYVQFSGPSGSRNLNAELADAASTGMWSTNGALSGKPIPSYGEVDQILYSRGIPGMNVPVSEQWNTANATTIDNEAFFNGFMSGANSYSYNGATIPITETTAQVPYVPQRVMSDVTIWEANDPLVHYTPNDLNYINPGAVGLMRADNGTPLQSIPDLNLNQVGTRYQPWGLSKQMAGMINADTNAYNLGYRDPGVWRSDYWQFPTNLYPTVGWLGRVHRGTPWQTIYLKSPDIWLQTNINYAYQNSNNGTNTWLDWTGNNGNWFDANNARPVYDRWLFDIFTAAPSDNATLGQLSVNQPHMAAWSAVLSGLPIFTNFAGPATIFQPAGLTGTNYVPGNGTNYLGYIWNSIQQTRTTLFANQAFAHLGDILATPALTTQSPFLVWSNSSAATAINDQMYEWIPQQTLSLLKLGTPRYVIYIYGQALKPAVNGIMTGGQYPLMCTNYQIVAETSARAVVEVENPSSANPRIVIKNINPLPADQ